MESVKRTLPEEQRLKGGENGEGSGYLKPAS